jgi:hypothetical protein
MKNISLLLCLLGVKLGFACTAFGIVSESGTIIGKNRDYYYDKQSFERVMPLKQFSHWYDNRYAHNNQFYAIVSDNDIKMGVNQAGLTAIEEDPLFAKKSDDRKFMQPINGNAEGMVLYGILQNFSTVDEIVPYITKIFSVAAPNFYQIADGRKILTVEVAYGTSNAAKSRRFTYELIDARKAYFTHTNTYLSPEFIALNNLQEDKSSVQGAQYRLKTITNFVNTYKNNDQVSDWFMDQKSDLTKAGDKNWCQNTSIFRSNVHEYKQIRDNVPNHKVYGTVSSMVVTNNSKGAVIELRMLKSIDTLTDGSQLIHYKELRSPLSQLFADKEISFTEKSFVRHAPVDGKCM